MVSPRIDKTSAWRALRAHRASCRELSISELFEKDKRRFSEFSLRFDDMVFDFSKTVLTGETVSLLCDLAETAKVSSRRDAMFSGEKVNETESRAASHTALRADRNAVIKCGDDMMSSVIASREEMLSYVEDCRRGRILSSDGGRFSDVVNIGIGGSHLGAALAETSLRSYCRGLRGHFISGADGAMFDEVMKGLDARRTLVIISSKTFTTEETMSHAVRAREWLSRRVGAGNVHMHMLASTSSREVAELFGIRHIFTTPESVGGRFSVWGSSGLLPALVLGRRHFLDFLSGARDMDIHFCTAPLRENLPVMLGLLGVCLKHQLRLQHLLRFHALWYQPICRLYYIQLGNIHLVIVLFAS